MSQQMTKTQALEALANSEAENRQLKDRIRVLTEEKQNGENGGGVKPSRTPTTGPKRHAIKELGQGIDLQITTLALQVLFGSTVPAELITAQTNVRQVQKQASKLLPAPVVQRGRKMLSAAKEDRAKELEWEKRQKDKDEEEGPETPPSQSERGG